MARVQKPDKVRTSNRRRPDIREGSLDRCAYILDRGDRQALAFLPQRSCKHVTLRNPLRPWPPYAHFSVCSFVAAHLKMSGPAFITLLASRRRLGLAYCPPARALSLHLSLSGRQQESVDADRWVVGWVASAAAAAREFSHKFGAPSTRKRCTTQKLVKE